MTAYRSATSGSRSVSHEVTSQRTTEVENSCSGKVSSPTTLDVTIPALCPQCGNPAPVDRQTFVDTRGARCQVRCLICRWSDWIIVRAETKADAVPIKHDKRCERCGERVDLKSRKHRWCRACGRIVVAEMAKARHALRVKLPKPCIFCAAAKEPPCAKHGGISRRERELRHKREQYRLWRKADPPFARTPKVVA